MKKTLAYLLMLIILIISLAACGHSDTPAPSSSSSDYRTDLIMRADAGSGNVTLDWHMDSSAATYNVYYGTSSTSLTKHNSSPVISAQYTISGLTNGTTYWFSVSGVNPLSVESKLQKPISAIPTSPAPPKAPENIRAIAGNATVTVTWDAVAGATSYNLYYEKFSSDMTAWSSPAEITGATSPYTGPYTAIPIENSTDTVTVIYMFWVTAVNSNGESSASFVVYAYPSATPPPQPPVITATPGNRQVYLDWSAVPGASYYNIYGGTAKGVTKNTAVIDSGSGTGYLVTTGITNCTKYYFVITAVNDNGTPTDTSDDLESAESNEASAIPTAGSCP